MVQSELAAIVLAAGITLSSTDIQQVWQAYLRASTFVDTGSANALVAGPPAGVTFQSANLGVGTTIQVVVEHNNTGASTFNWAGTGAKAVVRQDSSALVGGELLAGAIVTLSYDGTHWQTLNAGGFHGVVPVPNGGTGDTSLALGSVLVGNGTSAVTLAAPGTASFPLVSNGTGVVPTFQALNLDTACTGKLPYTQCPVNILAAHVAAGVFTFTVPADTFKIFGWCQAAGGAGAGSNTSMNSGGGGGAGGFVMGWFTVAPGDTITLTVGAGGNRGSATAVGDDGVAGNSSSIGSFMSATAGGGGECVANASGGTGGVGTGPIPWYCGGGNDGDYCTNGTVDTGPGGLGGASFFGGGTRASTTSGAPGNSAPGSGGGGGYGTSGTGNAGADGAIILWG